MCVSASVYYVWDNSMCQINLIWTLVHLWSVPICIFVVVGEPFGNILVSSSTSIASNHVFSFRFNQNMGHDISFLQSHQSVIKLCLHHCDVLFARSVAFPALGTGEFILKQGTMVNDNKIIYISLYCEHSVTIDCAWLDTLASLQLCSIKGMPLVLKSV